MPRLGCSVGECSYNSSGYCALNSIDVSGGGSKDTTCCSSFVAKNNGAMNSIENEYQNVTAYSDISCEAQDCIHNDNCECNADSIDICHCGSSCNCDSSRDTECSTFYKR